MTLDLGRSSQSSHPPSEKTGVLRRLKTQATLAQSRVALWAERFRPFFVFCFLFKITILPLVLKFLKLFFPLFYVYVPDSSFLSCPNILASFLSHFIASTLPLTSSLLPTTGTPLLRRSSSILLLQVSSYVEFFYMLSFFMLSFF